MRIGIYVSGHLVCTLSSLLQLKFHKPAKNGEHPWFIRNEDTGYIYDEYKPPKQVKSKPVTPIKGSWAESMKAA